MGDEHRRTPRTPEQAAAVADLEAAANRYADAFNLDEIAVVADVEVLDRAGYRTQRRITWRFSRPGSAAA